MNIAVFADVSNLYYCIGQKYGGRKLDYQKYLEFIKDLGTVSVARAYGSNLDHNTIKFITCLKSVGFEPKFKKPKRFDEKHSRADWKIGITLDAIESSPLVDTIVLGSADGDFATLVSCLKLRVRNVIVVACGISKELREVATRYIEIPESMLEVRNETP